MLETKDLVAGYGAMPILHGLSLQVAAGEYVGVLGHNGMGKTTLLRTLIGHVSPMAGSIAFDGRDITALPPNRRARLRIGYVPQGREIFPALTVREKILQWARCPVPRSGPTSLPRSWKTSRGWFLCSTATAVR